MDDFVTPKKEVIVIMEEITVSMSSADGKIFMSFGEGPGIGKSGTTKTEKKWDLHQITDQMHSKEAPAKRGRGRPVDPEKKAKREEKMMERNKLKRGRGRPSPDPEKEPPAAPLDPSSSDASTVGDAAGEGDDDLAMLGIDKNSVEPTIVPKPPPVIYPQPRLPSLVSPTTDSPASSSSPVKARDVAANVTGSSVFNVYFSFGKPSVSPKSVSPSVSNGKKEAKPEKRLGKLRVVPLKRELDSRGISTSGNKVSLVERLRVATVAEWRNPDDGIFTDCVN